MLAVKFISLSEKKLHLLPNPKILKHEDINYSHNGFIRFCYKPAVCATNR